MSAKQAAAKQLTTKQQTTKQQTRARRATAASPGLRNTESTEGLPFEIRRSAIQGRGAFATRRMRAGQKIVEYTGERISQAEGDRRYAENGMERHHTFLFTLDDDVLIDGARGGNASRFLNHSCDPNCEAVIHGDGADARIFFHALRNIQPGTELTFDYKYERTSAHTDEDERFYACRCGSPKCRGTIRAPKKAARRGGRGRAKRGA
jgi:SET domain-containing protein